jgi:hypothetical protein
MPLSGRAAAGTFIYCDAELALIINGRFAPEWSLQKIF